MEAIAITSKSVTAFPHYSQHDRIARVEIAYTN
jgi:hypothetical protein